MPVIQVQYYKTKIGELILGSYEGSLCLLDFRYRRMRKTVDKRLQMELNASFQEIDTSLLQETRKQLDEYLFGERQVFSLPLLLVGSDFQQLVWQALMKVKYGAVASYLDLAKSIGNEKAVRAVAAANGANAIAIIVPCHRIIGSDGSLVGYGGGLSIKKRLLALEGRAVQTEIEFDKK